IALQLDVVSLRVLVVQRHGDTVIERESRNDALVPHPGVGRHQVGKAFGPRKTFSTFIAQLNAALKSSTNCLVMIGVRRTRILRGFRASQSRTQSLRLRSRMAHEL